MNTNDHAPAPAEACSEFLQDNTDDSDAHDQMGDINAGVWFWCLAVAVFFGLLSTLINHFSSH